MSQRAYWERGWIAPHRQCCTPSVVHWSNLWESILKGLAEDIKLSVCGRQPIQLFVFVSIQFIFFYFLFSLVVFIYWHSFRAFHDAHFHYTVGVVFYFLGQMCLHPSLGEFVSPLLFLLSLLFYLYPHIEDNVEFKFGGKECPFVYMLSFDKKEKNWECVAF